MKRLIVAVALVGAFAAWAHREGFHKKDLVTVSEGGVEVLVTIDIDSGKRCRILRAGADADRDGKLSPEELGRLKEKLVRQAVRPLAIEVATYPVPLRVVESKLSLREDFRASDTGLSVAVVLRGDFPSKPTAGMKLEVRDESPDHSHVLVEVFEGEKSTRKDLQRGESLQVSLGQ